MMSQASLSVGVTFIQFQKAACLPGFFYLRGKFANHEGGAVVIEGLLDLYQGFRSSFLHLRVSFKMRTTFLTSSPRMGVNRTFSSSSVILAARTGSRMVMA
jgi:hypothetical protein